MAEAVDDETHAPGYVAKLDSVTKWVLAALAMHNAAPSDLLLADSAYAPNDPLASKVAETLSKWSIDQITARDAGVVDPRKTVMDSPPPQEIVPVGCNWMRRHINQVRRGPEHRLPALPKDWGIHIAGRVEASRAANKATGKRKKADGTRYHHKHDLAPSQDQLTTLVHTGLTADPRVAVDILDAIEAGMAVALYLPTGARGSELKNMHLQSMGQECIEEPSSGLAYDCLKLTAYDTKTKNFHLNQCLSHVHPWRDGIGLLGVSLLMRIRMFSSAPPITMQLTEQSWRILGTSSDTLDTRIKAAFAVAGIRRQKKDPVTYLGRHFGTRLLQHAGGSSEGGAARTGHATKDARQTYTECPLPDLKRMVGRDVVPQPAHLHPDTQKAAAVVRDLLYPEYMSARNALDARQQEVDRIGGARADRLRTEEQLNDQDRVLRALDMLTLTAVRILVARPRTWKQWKILETARSIWEEDDQRRRDDSNEVASTHNRLLALLFKDKPEAVDAMNKLAAVVRRREEAEIVGRCTSPEALAATAFSEAVYKSNQQNHAMLARIEAHLKPSVPPVLALAVDKGALATDEMTSITTTTTLTAPLVGARIKRKRELQEDVKPISEWTRISDMLAYARDTLAPLEKQHGRKWRDIPIEGVTEDGRQRRDKSRDTLWRKYKTVAIAVGLRGGPEEEAVADLQTMLHDLGERPYKRFDTALKAEVKMKNMPDASTEALAAKMLGYA